MFKLTKDLIKSGKQTSNSSLGLDLNKPVIKRHFEDNWRSVNKGWLSDDFKC